MYVNMDWMTLNFFVHSIHKMFSLEVLDGAIRTNTCVCTKKKYPQNNGITIVLDRVFSKGVCRVEIACVWKMYDSSLGYLCKLSTNILWQYGARKIWPLIYLVT